jgi:hypothetical protein
MSDRGVEVLLVVIGLALLSASALSVLMTSGPVAQLGGSGMSEVPRDGVIVERVRLLQETSLASNSYNRIEVRLRTSSSIYNGPYTVCIETNRGNFCATNTVTTTGRTFTFYVTSGIQEPTVSVRVYAAAG